MSGMPMPAFRCNACRRRFNRLTGTPLARLRHADKLPEFARLLSCQMSYKEAAEILEVDYTAVANWAEKFRTWLLALDPSGRWEARVRLGLKPRPLIACPVCGKDGNVRFAGFHEDGTWRLACCRQDPFLEDVYCGRRRGPRSAVPAPASLLYLEKRPGGKASSETHSTVALSIKAQEQRERRQKLLAC